MQQVAIAWQLFEMTDSTFQVGLVGAFGIAPFLVLSFVGGTIADRFERRRIMMLTQSVTMLNAFWLFVATLTGVITPGLIYAISFISGLSRAFDGPARQALIPNLVPREELANALTMNTMLRQVATIVGPGIGGISLGLFGVGPTYGLNALTTVAIIGALALMRDVPVPPRQRARTIEMAVGGLRFVRREPVVLAILGLDWLVNLLGSLRVLMPVYARDILEVGPGGLGLLYAAPAAGAVTGALILGAVGMRWRHPGIILAISAGFGLFIIGFALSTVFALSLFMLFGTGFMDVVGEVVRTTLVQLRTPDELRGRVTALTIIFTNGGPQLGQLQGGAIASAFGPVEAAFFGGIGVLASTLAFAFNPHLRRPPQEPAPIPVISPERPATT
jgi:MFS family permease